MNSKGKEAKFWFKDQALMKYRNGLVADSRLTQATGTEERAAALEMVKDIPSIGKITLGANRGYGPGRFVDGLLRLRATAPVAQTT